MRSLAARITALLVALAVLAPGVASARTRYFCRMMHRVVVHCCCKQEQTRAAWDEGPRIAPQSCCERIAAAPRATTIKPTAVDWPVPPASLAQLLPELVHGGAVTSSDPPTRSRARGPPGARAPVFLEKCALLR